MPDTNIELSQLDIEILTWEDARLLLLPILPELVSIIDKLSPSQDLVLYKASYPFGSTIINKQNYYLPLAAGKTISFNSPFLPEKIRNDLSYDPATNSPIGIVLSRKSEFFVEIDERVIPYAILEPGGIFGSSKVLDKITHNLENNLRMSYFAFVWELRAGARSIFALPKISNRVYHQKMAKRLQLPLSLDAPRGYYQHWDIFKSIANRYAPQWKAEFLFFSNAWLEKLTDRAWLPLFNFFLVDASSMARNR